MRSTISFRYVIFLLPLLLVLLLFSILTADPGTEKLEFKELPEPAELSTLTILSPTQDTILYDNNTAAYLDTTLDTWTGVRFTPLTNFELQAIYFAILNQYSNTTDGCSLYVVADDGAGEPDWPSGKLDAFWVPPPLLDMIWMQVDLSSPVSFAAHEDFHVFYGPAPGGSHTGTGWWNLRDSDGSATQRSHGSHDNRQTWLTIGHADAFIRAGGEYTPLSYSWSSNGPTDIPVISLAIHPSYPGTIYAGTVDNGIYISPDGGDSWASVSTDIDTLYVVTIAINPQNPQVLYAGTMYGFETTGIYKTTDGGTNWARTSSGIEDLDIRSIAIDPDQPDTVYVGAFIHWESWLGRGIYRTSEGGVSWSQVVSGLEPVYDLVVKDLVIDPSAPQTVYAGAVHDGPGHGGIFKTTDGGESWSPRNQGLQSLRISCLAIDPNDNSTLYACTRDSSIFKSINGGDSWFRPTSVIIEHITSIAIDPNNSQRIFVGTESQGVYQSQNGGADWETINAGLGNLSVYALDIVCSRGTILYAATESGVWGCDIGEARRQK